MTVQQTAERLAAELTGRIDTPVLDDRPHVRLMLGREVLAGESLPGASGGEQAWLAMCADLADMARRLPYIDSTLQAHLGDALIELGAHLAALRPMDPNQGAFL